MIFDQENLWGYKDFLKLLKKKPSRRCSCPSHLHQRNWIPPPCLSSKPIKFSQTGTHRRSSSSPLEYNMAKAAPSKKNVKKETSPSLAQDEIGLRVKQIENDLKSLRDAQRKLENGEEVSDFTKKLVLEWKHKYSVDDLNEQNEPPPTRDDNSHLASDMCPLDDDAAVNPEVVSMFRRLEAAAKETQREEGGPGATSKMTSTTSHRQRTLEVENRKLKKKLKNLSYLKSHDRTNLDLEHERHKRSALKKKYEDLLKHVKSLEAENASLKLKKKRRTDDAGTEENVKELPHSDGFPGRERFPQSWQHDVRRANSHYDAVEIKKTIDDVDALKSAAYVRAQQDLEAKWQSKVSQVEEIYEKVILGYKAQLNKKQEQLDLLQDQKDQQIRLLVKKEQELSLKHETDVQKLHEKISSLRGSNRQEASRVLQDRIDNLQKVVVERDAQIGALKDSLKKQVEMRGIKELVGEMEANLISKMDILVKDALNGSASEKSQSRLMQSLKEIFKDSLEDWKNVHESLQSRFLAGGGPRNPNIAGRKPQFEGEMCHSCEEYKARMEHLVAKDASLKQQIEEEKEATQRIILLNEDLQRKLLESESAKNKYHLEEKALAERLQSSVAESEQWKRKIETLEEQLTVLDQERRQLALLAEKIPPLERELGAKNDLLSLNSAQLEERIRENANLLSQIERLKEENLKASSVQKSGELSLQTQLKELQTENERLRRQQSNFRKDKERLERTFKTQTKSFEDKIEELTLKSASHQKQFETISKSYKSIFGGREWALLPPATPPLNPNLNKDAL